MHAVSTSNAVKPTDDNAPNLLGVNSSGQTVKVPRTALIAGAVSTTEEHNILRVDDNQKLYAQMMWTGTPNW